MLEARKSPEALEGRKDTKKEPGEDDGEAEGSVCLREGKPKERLRQQGHPQNHCPPLRAPPHRAPPGLALLLAASFTRTAADRSSSPAFPGGSQLQAPAFRARASQAMSVHTLPAPAGSLELAVSEQDSPWGMEQERVLTCELVS